MANIRQLQGGCSYSHSCQQTKGMEGEGVSRDPGVWREDSCGFGGGGGGEIL